VISPQSYAPLAAELTQAPVRFFEQDPRASTYPLPTLPVLPVLSSHTFRRTACQGHPTRFLDEDCLLLRSGRAAIAHALRLCGVGAGDEVLLPAYHCGSMVEPALWLGAQARFFHVDRDLTLDLESLQAELTPRSRAAIVPHYFGCPQPLDGVLALRDRYGFKLIEDCAHALFGTDGRHTLGTQGEQVLAAVDGSALAEFLAGRAITRTCCRSPLAGDRGPAAVGPRLWAIARKRAPTQRRGQALPDSVELRNDREKRRCWAALSRSRSSSFSSAILSAFTAVPRYPGPGGRRVGRGRDRRADRCAGRPAAGAVGPVCRASSSGRSSWKAPAGRCPRLLPGCPCARIGSPDGCGSS